MNKLSCGILILTDPDREVDGYLFSRRYPQFEEILMTSPYESPLEGLVSALYGCQSDALITVDANCPIPAELAEYLASFANSGWPAWALCDRSQTLFPLCGVYTKKALPVLEDAAFDGFPPLQAFAACGGFPLSLQHTVFPDALLTKPPVPVFSVCGLHNSGKTTLITHLLPIFHERGLKVAVLKHDAHGFTPDVPGTDSYKLREAGADPVAVYSPTQTMYTVGEELPLQALIAEAARHADLILLEGQKQSHYPKLEVLGDPEAIPASHEPLAFACDFTFETPLPCFSRTDYAAIAAFILQAVGLDESL